MSPIARRASDSGESTVTPLALFAANPARSVTFATPRAAFTVNMFPSNVESADA